MSTVDQLLFVVTLLAVLGCGLIAGVFFAFSAFVMKALARLPPGEGIAAMQSINIVVLNPWFLGVFLGTAAICVMALIASLLRWHQPGAVYLLVGAALYLLGIGIGAFWAFVIGTVIGEFGYPIAFGVMAASYVAAAVLLLAVRESSGSESIA